MLFLVLLVLPALSSEVNCQGCHDLLDSFSRILSNQSLMNHTQEHMVSLCTFFMRKEVCEGLNKLYTSNWFDVLSQKYLDPSFTCSVLGACSTPKYLPNNFSEYTKQVLKDMPSQKTWPDASGSTFKVAQVTDMHVDWNYKPGSEERCHDILCCREGKGSAGLWGTRGRCDPPPQTVQVFLDQINNMDIDFVVWTGDNPPHNIWAYEREAEMNVTKKLVKMFRETLKVPVYPVIGNHDCFPMDLFKPSQEQLLLNSLAELWSAWLSPPEIKQFLENGFYSTKNKETGLKIIGINSEMGDNFNTWLILNNTDPGNMLAWLRKELYQAETSNEKVLIIGHIPPGGRFGESDWAMRYQVIINRFQNIIVGQMFGHTHQDEFELVPSLVEGLNPASVLHVAPSFTSFSFQNPSFRVYEFDLQTKHLVDVHQYRLPLYKLDRTEPSFEKAYSMKEEYAMKDLSASSFEKLVEDIRNNSTLAQKFYNNYFAVYSFEAQKCNQECMQMLYCRVKSNIFNDYMKCVESPLLPDYALYVFQELMGNWLYKSNHTY